MPKSIFATKASDSPPLYDSSKAPVVVGKSGEAVSAGETRLGGRIPVNTSGGLKSKGHPVGASGVAQIIEVTDQLRGAAGERQVEGARVGLAQNMGGSGASCVVHILEGVS